MVLSATIQVGNKKFSIKGIDDYVEVYVLSRVDGSNLERLGCYYDNQTLRTAAELIMDRGESTSMAEYATLIGLLTDIFYTAKTEWVNRSPSQFGDNIQSDGDKW